MCVFGVINHAVRLNDGFGVLSEVYRVSLMYFERV